MLSVPLAIAGRIIGRQGKNVREIQRMTGATVRLSDDASSSDETTAEVYGNFMATQVNFHLLLLMSKTSEFEMACKDDSGYIAQVKQQKSTR